MNNILQILLSPLSKLSESTKEQSKALKTMSDILVKWDTEYEIGKEIKTQTVLLADIKQLLIQQNKQLFGKNNKKEAQDKDKAILGDASKFKALKDTAGLAAMVIGVSIAIVGASLILSTVTAISPMQIVTALAIAGLILLITPAFVKIGDAFFGSKLEEKTDKEGSSKSMTNKGGFLGIAGGLVGLLGMLSVVVIASYLVQLIGQPSVANIITALVISVLFIPLAYAYSLVTKELAKGMGTKTAKVDGEKMSVTDTSGIWALAGAGLLSIVGLIGAVVLSSWLLMLTGQPTGAQFLVALGVAIIMIPLAFAMGRIMDNLIESGIKPNKDGLKMIGLALLVIVTGIVGLVAASWILQMINTNLTMQHFLVALGVGISLIPVAWAMGMLINKLVDAGIKPDMSGVKMIFMAGLAIAMMAGGIVGAAWILLALPDPAQMLAKMPPLMWSVTVGLSMLAFSLSYALILKAMKGASIAEMLLAGAALVIMSLAILGVAWLFTHLPDKWNGPDYEWSFKIGLALLMFAIPFALISLLVNKFKLTTKTLLQAVMAVVIISLAIFLVAWVFTLLPDQFNAPPEKWSLSAAIVIGAFGVALAKLGKVMGGAAGIEAIAYAAAGAIIVAVAILAIAWIFNWLPDMGEIGGNIANLIVVPINKLIDVLVRIKDEIGVQNLVPLAIGIGAISLSLLLLAGATAGLAAGGVLAALGQAASDFIGGISEFFGGSKPKGPLEVLDHLLHRRKRIAELAPALEAVAIAARGIITVASAGTTLGNILRPIYTYGEKAYSNLFFIAKAIDDIDVKSIVTMANPFAKISSAMNVIGSQPINSMKAATHFAKVLSESSFDKQAVALEKIAKAYKSIAESTKEINQISIDKTTNMIKALGYLSNNGAQGAIDKLGDNLIKAIEELGNLLEKYIEADGGKDKGGSLIDIDFGGGKGGSKVDMTPVVNAISQLKTQLTTTGVKISNTEDFG